MNTEKKAVVSLGMSCQTTHQLRRLTSAESQQTTTQIAALSGPMDWLICPPHSTIQLLKHRFPDFTKDDIQIRKGRAYWSEFNLYFWHSFLVDDGEQRQVCIDKTFENELSRWRYLRDRFSTLNPTQTVFVLSNTQNNLRTEVFRETEQNQYRFTPELLEELHWSLAGFFSTAISNIHLEVITRTDLTDNIESCAYGYLLPHDQHEWKGSNKSWDQWWHQLHDQSNR